MLVSIVELLGLALVVAGAWLAGAPLGLMVTGAALVALAYSADRSVTRG